MKGFYSPVDKLAAELPRTKGTGAEFMTELSKRPGYKPQEAQDRDLQTLMALPKMAREEFLAQLKAKPAPQLEDTTLTNKSGRSKFDQWTLPGGSNYREILMRMPHDEQRAKEFQDPASGHWDQPNVLAHVRAKDRTGPNGEKLLHIEEIQSDWHQQGREHGYATPELLQEFRAAELRHKLLKRQLDEAKAQSESAENSLKRKEPLFQQPDVRERYEAARVKANNDLMDLMPQVMKAQAEVQDFGHKMNSMVPNAPFKKNWHEMALKKMIHHAAENGYHGIVITPGAEQADRYNLAKYVNAVSVSPTGNGTYMLDATLKGGGKQTKTNLSPSDVENMVGKELAAKLLTASDERSKITQSMREALKNDNDDEYDRLREVRKSLPPAELAGLDLQVGGEGMKGFYDKMVPSFLNQFGKKYGAQVQPGSVSIVSTPAQHHGLTESQFQAQSPDEQQRMVRQHAYAHQGAKTEIPVHHFPITPEMREDVTKNGVPLYAKGGAVEVKPTSYDPNLQRRHPKLEEAIRGVAAGTTTHKQLDKLIAKHKPIKPYEFVPKPATLEDAQRGLNKNQIKAWRAHEDWPEGTSIGGRLDINAYEHHGVWANSIHDESGEKRPTSYGPVISIKNVTFDPNPGKSEEVGTGEKRKSPFARIKGELHHMTEDEAVQHMVDNLHHPDYAQVGYDPRRHGHFYDRKTLQPVTHSPHVVQIGPLALAHKPTYGKRENYATGGDVHSSSSAMGINVRSDKKANLQYADLIVDGHKTYESRNGDTLRPYVGKRVSIVRTGDGPAKAIGAVTVGEPMVVNRKKFREMEQHHLVPKGSAFDITNETKHLYPMHDPERYESERDVGHGIVARKVHMTKGGSIKPVGYTKEKVTVSPSLDQMRYELISVKHSKKVK